MYQAENKVRKKGARYAQRKRGPFSPKTLTPLVSWPEAPGSLSSKTVHSRGKSDKEMKETVNTLLIVDWWFENRPDHLWFLSLPISQSQTDMLIGMIFLRVCNVGRTDTCTDMAESLRCLPKTVTTLLIDYTPIQNKKFEFKNKQTKKNMLYRKFPAVKVLCFYLQGPGFNPWLGNWDPTSRDVWPK